jgi:hypothetical protein
MMIDFVSDGEQWTGPIGLLNCDHQLGVLHGHVFQETIPDHSAGQMPASIALIPRTAGIRSNVHQTHDLSEPGKHSKARGHVFM